MTATMSHESILRAMSKNYAPGNIWDKLDIEVCKNAADEIKQLRDDNGTQYEIRRLYEALELCEDVLKHVQKAYNCPDSPIINKARLEAALALELVGDKREAAPRDTTAVAQSIEPPLSIGDVQCEFYAWWEANQVDRLHGMIAQNCALAAWHEAYDRYVRNSHIQKSAPPILAPRRASPSGERLPSSDAAVGGADTPRFDPATAPCFICGRTLGEHSLDTADICNAFIGGSK